MADFLSVWWISLAGFLALWPISLWRKDASIVDFWWGPGVGAMMLVQWAQLGFPMSEGTLMLVSLTVLWSARLGIHLGIRRIREGTEDARYVEMREARNPGWWLKSLFMVFILQSVIQGAIAAPLVLALPLAGDLGLSPLSLLAIAAILFGLWLQTVADLELDRHRALQGHGKVLTTGLRAVVRHPNYLGEIIIWIALSLLAMLGGIWWAPVSALIVTLLLRYVSGVTIIEDRMMRTRPEEFPAYRDRVPALIPRFQDIRTALQQRGTARIR